MRMKQKANGFMTLKIELPPTGIVRKVSVPASMTLDDLNEAIQAVMGWKHEHLWHFQDGRCGPIYEIPHEDDFASFGMIQTFDAQKISLAKALPRRGAKLTYEYDFGDSWDHTVTRMSDPKVAEIACLTSEGPDGLEDFGGQWRLAEFLKAMHTNPNDGEWAETREWCGFDEPEELAAYLAGESVEVKTEKLRKALKNVKIVMPEQAASKQPKMSDAEQARTLGMLFATIVCREVWAVLRDALKHGGKCEFVDYDKQISTYLQTTFDGLKITDGEQTPFCTNASKLKVHKKWVEWYATYGADWETVRGPFDILEEYAHAAVRLYGAVTQPELYDIIRRYDPGIELGIDEIVRYLEARALWSGIGYRIEGDLIVDKVAFSLDQEDSESALDDLLKARKGIDRWYPADREELFKWASHQAREHSPESDAVELVLRSLGNLNADEAEGAMDGIYDLISAGLTPEGIYQSLIRAGILERISTKPRQRLLDALDAWLETIRIQCLNGHTVRELREAETQKALEPKISRNAPCPCGSGKKYKLCCGMNK